MKETGVMENLTEKNTRLLNYIRNGWARWLPLLGIDLLMAVIDAEQSGGDIAACRTLNAFLFRADVLSHVPAYFIEEDAISKSTDPDSVQRLRERQQLVAILTELVGLPPLRTLGDLLDLLCRLRIVEAMNVGRHTCWRVSDPLPSVLDFEIPPHLREQELLMQSEYVLRDHLGGQNSKTKN